jgi:predicted peptidase
MTTPTRLLLLLTFIGAGIIQSLAQHASVHPEYSRRTYQGMTYGIFVPTNYHRTKSYPLILYLHGSGDTVSHDRRWYSEAWQKDHASFVITPKTTERNQGWGNTWDARHAPAASKTLSLVDSLLKVYSIDKSRLYIYGISMGGFGTFSILQKNPGKFAAGFAICGGSDPAAAKSLLNTPLWIFHGDADDVVPVRLSRDVYSEMIRLGGKKVKYTEYPGVKHNSWENALREPGLGEWLFEQRLR